MPKIEADYGITGSLKLSQEPDLDPGLLLPVYGFHHEMQQVDASGSVGQAFMASFKDLFHAQGTVWAPAYVGVQVNFSAGAAGLTTWDVDVHLDYEEVEFDWMDWFIHWDFLDNVKNNERQY